MVLVLVRGAVVDFGSLGVWEFAWSSRWCVLRAAHPILIPKTGFRVGSGQPKTAQSVILGKKI